MLGGREGTKPLPLSQCFLLDTDTYEWTTIPDVHAVADDGGRAGAAPKNRYAHSVALLSEHSATAPAAAAPAGAPAAGAATEAAISASSRAYAARLLMFGGHGGRSRYFSDVAELIISVPTAVSERPEAKWVSISCTGTPPPRRSGHAMVHLGHRCVTRRRPPVPTDALTPTHPPTLCAPAPPAAASCLVATMAACTLTTCTCWT